MLQFRRFVYILKNHFSPPLYYTGSTADLAKRLCEHNRGESRHTAGSGPWELEVAVGFLNADRAARFEKYLKSGSGREFARRHFR